MTERQSPLADNIIYFIKWTWISCLMGGAGGAVGAAFSHCVGWAGAFRQTHPWTLYLMPIAGLLIVWMYHLAKEEDNKGTNGILTAVSSTEEVSPATGPLIFIGTVLTHLVGGSSGREGAALQIGGSMGNFIGKKMKLDEKDRKIVVMCGMSALFGALFGTPVAAGIFSMEVISVGVLYYAALVPCLFSSFIGTGISVSLGMKPEKFQILEVPEFTVKTGLFIVFLGILCAVASILFCMILHKAQHLYQKHFKNPYIRILAASILFIVLTQVVGTKEYLGSGSGIIEKAMEGHTGWGTFLLKMVFTAMVLGAGFKGGEIVPTMSIGASFGCAVGLAAGVSPSLCAACGLAALFVGVTNCPVSALIIALEMFGYEAMPYFAIIVAVSFTLSGYYGLYSSQKFVYSKIRTEFINRKAN